MAPRPALWQRSFLPRGVLVRLASAVLVGAASMACQAHTGIPRESEASTPSADAIEAVADPADEELVLNRIGAARQAREHGPIRLVNEEPQLQSALRAIRDGAPPLAAVRTAMQRLAESESAEVQGWSVEADDLGQASIPSALLEGEEPAVAIVIVRYRSPPGPRFAIVYVLIHDGESPSLHEGRLPARERLL